MFVNIKSKCLEIICHDWRLQYINNDEYIKIEVGRNLSSIILFEKKSTPYDSSS